MKQIGIILNPSAKINSRRTAAVIKNRLITGPEDFPSLGDSRAAQPLIMTPLIKNRSSAGTN